MGKTSVARIDKHAIMRAGLRVSHPGLKRPDYRTLLEDDIDLGADIVPPEENIRIEALVESRLEELRNDKGLEKDAAARVDKELM